MKLTIDFMAYMALGFICAAGLVGIGLMLHDVFG